jgi:MFS family permease
MIQAGLRSANSTAPLYVATGFLVLALLTVLAGTAADAYGRRLLLLAGLAGLTLSNVLGMVSLDAPKAFAVADTINAIAGVVVLPAAIAVVTLTFEAPIRPFAYAILFSIQGTAMVVGMMLIPLLGDAWNGRGAFAPVLLLGVVAIVLVVRRIPESRTPSSMRRASILVNLVLMVGLFLTIFLIVTAGIRSERALLIVAVATTLVLFAGVVRWLARRLRYFRDIEVHGGRDLGLAVFAGVMMLFAQGCFFFQITPFFWSVQGVGDIEGAVRFVPYVVGLLAGGMVLPRLAGRFGARRILVFSFLMSGVALLVLSFIEVDTQFWVMIGPTALLGFAFGLSSPARTTVVMSARPEGLVNSSAAVNTAAGQSGYALGVIISSVLVTQYADRTFLAGLSSQGVSPETVSRVSAILQTTSSRLIAAGYPGLPDAVEAVTGVSYSGAFTSGMTRMFLMVAVTMFLTALVVFVGMRRGLRASLASTGNEQAA